MIKRRACEEVCSGNGHEYLFSGTIGNIEAASFVAGDPAQLYSDLNDGKLPPTKVRAVITCCMIEVDGKPVVDLDLEAEAKAFMDDFGLQDCSYMARRLMSHALIGTVKKKQLEREETATGLIEKLPRFRSMTSAQVGWSWVAISIALGISACMISRLF